MTDLMAIQAIFWFLVGYGSVALSFQIADLIHRWEHRKTRDNKKK
jgi:hypothetical protein